MSVLCWRTLGHPTAHAGMMKYLTNCEDWTASNQELIDLANEIDEKVREFLCVDGGLEDALVYFGFLEAVRFVAISKKRQDFLRAAFEDLLPPAKHAGTLLDVLAERLWPRIAKTKFKSWRRKFGCHGVDDIAA